MAYFIKKQVFHNDVRYLLFLRMPGGRIFQRNVINFTIYTHPVWRKENPKADDAIKKVREYVEKGYRYAVSPDLTKYF